MRILLCLSILSTLLLVGCESKSENHDSIDYKSWKSATLQKLEYSRVYEIHEDDFKEISDYLLNAKESDIQIEDTQRFLYRIHIETEIDEKNTDPYWTIFEVDGINLIKDDDGLISETEHTFIELLDQLYDQ